MRQMCCAMLPKEKPNGGTTVKKRLLSVLLILCMVFTLMPISAFAEGGTAAPACTCDTACTAESMNTACTVCGADGAMPEQCGKYVAAEQPTDTHESTDTPAPASTVTLTMLLPVGLKVEGMEKVDDSTNKVTRTVDENGISPIVITSADEGAFSTELAEALSNTDAFKNNNLTASYDESTKTITVSGSPAASVELDMNDILTAAMDAIDAYAAEEADTHTHCVCGGNSAISHTHVADTTWTGISNLSQITTGGNYYLKDNVTLTSTWTIGTSANTNITINLCLNGHKISASMNDAVITNWGTLSITDCNSTGEITHNNAVTGSECRGIDNYGGMLNLWNGIITGNTVTHKGGGVYNAATFNMYGGSITNNAVTTYSSSDIGGAGVCNNENGKFNMYGGVISSNTAGSSAQSVFGGGVSSVGTFNMYGGSITGNIANASGGGVYNTGTFTMTGGTISGNKSCKETGSSPDPGGGGVYNYGTFNMSGGSITANTAAYCGGGVRNVYYTFNMTGGEISGNTASKSGGGVYSDGSGTFTMSGSAKISSNTATKEGGGVYFYNGTFTMSGGSITGNSTTTYGGGGVYNQSGTFTMTSGSITGNTAATSGGGVYNSKAFTMSGGSITGNTSNSYGGGVYSTDTLNISGAPSITGNKLENASNNVYLSSGKTITVNGSMDNTASVGITAAYPTKYPTVVTGSTDTTVFSSDNTDYALVGNGSDGLKLAEKTVTISGVKLLNTTGGTAMTDNTKVYDGEAVEYDNTSVTYSPNVSDVTLTYTWQIQSGGTYTNLNAAPSDAGDYRLHVTAKRNNTTLGTANYDFTITKGTGKGTVKLDGWTYGDTAKNPTATSTTNPETTTDKITYLYKVEGTADDTYTETKPTNAGSYTVKATFPANDNYTAATATADFTIKPKTLTATITVKDKTYDGTTDAKFDGEPTLTGVVAGDSEKVTANVANPAFEDKNVGENKKVTASISLSGDAAGNYTVNAKAETTATISVKEVSITGVTVADSKTYDKTTAAKITNNGTINGKVIEDNLTITVGTATYNNANVGTNKTVTFTGFELTGTDAKNYTLKAQPTSVTASITAKELGVTVTASNKAYDGTTTVTATATLDTTQLITGDTVTLDDSGMNANFDTAAVGENKTVTVTGLTLDGDAAKNYKLPVSITGKANITKATGSGSVTLDGWIYGETAKTPQPTSTTNGVSNVTYRYKLKGSADTEYSDKAPTNAGTYTVEATFPENSNYTAATATADFTIKPKPLTMTATAQDKTYDGTQTATLNTATLVGVEAADKDKVTLDATGVSASFDDANAGENKSITLTGEYKLNGTAANNYILTQPTGLTAKITPAPLTLTVKAEDKKLDGNNTAGLDIKNAKLEGMIEGHESVTVGSATATFVGDGCTAQDNVTVNVTNIKLTGEDAGNYKVETVKPVTANLLPLFVDFMNGETKINSVEVGSYGAAVETAAPTKEGHSFAGWYTDAACTKAWNSEAGVTSDVTVYAKWTKDTLYTVSGKVTGTGEDSSGKSGATVELWSGSACISATVTGNDGTYSFGNVPNGVYNIVAKTKDRAVTKTVTVKDGNATLNIALPSSSVAAEVKVTPGTAGEKSIVAGTTVTGMDDTLIEKVTTSSSEEGKPSKPQDGERLEVKLNVKDGAQEEEMTAIKSRDTTRSNWDFVEMNVDWTKYSTASGGITGNGKITDTVQVLAIRIPYDMSGKCNIVAYRYHAEGSVAKVAALTVLSNEPNEGNYKDGTYYIGDGYIVIYTKKFSAFGVGYTADSVAPVITGAENGKTYCAAVTLTITDENLATVTVNGAAVTLTDGKLTLNPAEGMQTVTATDKAGNSTSITVTVNDGHTWGAWSSNGDGTHTRICTVDSTHTEKGNCTGGTATCSAAAVCTTCSASYGTVNPNNHSALTHVPYKAATVYSAGNIEYWYCSGCGKYYLDANATNAIAQPRTIIPRIYSGIRTGDDSDLTLWLTLLLLSGAGIGAAMLAGRKRKHNR